MSASDSLHPVQFRFEQAQPRSMGGSKSHRVVAFDHEGGTAGHMEWSHRTGEIQGVHVWPEHRRQGIATQMLGQARTAAATTRGVKPPRHSTQRTIEGEAWARSLGDRLPRRSEQ